MVFARFIQALGACAVALATAGPAAAGVVLEAEADLTAANNTLATAQLIDAAFSPGAPATAFPGFGQYATVLGRLADPTGVTFGDVDFYQFTTLGGAAIFDIDNNPYQFDTVLSLFDSTGTLIAFDDDSYPEDAGTEFGLDSFIGVITLAPGTYYVTVTQYPNFATVAFTPSSFDPLTRPDGEYGGYATPGTPPGDSSFSYNDVQPLDALPYQLIIGLEFGPQAVPAPAGLVLGLIGVGCGGLARVVRRLR